MSKTEIVRAIQATHWPDNDDEKVAALIQALEDAGMVILPVEPTEAMVADGHKAQVQMFALMLGETSLTPVDKESQSVINAAVRSSYKAMTKASQ